KGLIAAGRAGALSDLIASLIPRIDTGALGMDRIVTADMVAGIDRSAILGLSEFVGKAALGLSGVIESVMPSQGVGPAALFAPQPGSAVVRDASEAAQADGVRAVQAMEKDR